MNKSDIINYLIQKYGFTSYLEIGLDNPDGNFNKINCENKESCDPYINDNWDGKYSKDDLPDNIKNVLTYHMTSDEMFKINNNKYDIIFIDGYHEQMQVGRDIINSLRHLNPNGFIIVHDCLPPYEACQIMPRQQSEWNGDVWKAIPKLKDQKIECQIIDTDYGVGIIKYFKNWKNLHDITEVSSLNWQDFENNRFNLIDIISIDEFKKLY